MSSVRNERPIERRKRAIRYHELIEKAEGHAAKENLMALAHLECLASRVTKALHLAVQAVTAFEDGLAAQHDAIDGIAYGRLFGDYLQEDLEAETKDNLCQAGALQSRLQDEMEGGPR